MILIPEIETVLLLVPRTGTRSLKHAIAERYPHSVMLYRHMEADGVPQGYDRWRKFGVVRHPVHRMWSLYNYLKTFGIDDATKVHGHLHPDYTRRLRESVVVPFEDWLLHNERVFATAHGQDDPSTFWPLYTVRHPMPETRKSQFIYLRPDLGTHIFRFRELHLLHDMLGINPGHLNRTTKAPMPELSANAQAHTERWFSWDMRNC